jgi:hypothetical protein
MRQCSHCEGFIPQDLSKCPNCLRNKPSFKHRLKRATQLVLGSSIAMTLAACYGTPPPIQPCDTTQDPGTTCVGTPDPNSTPDSNGSASPTSSASPSAQASASPQAEKSATP